MTLYSCFNLRGGPEFFTTHKYLYEISTFKEYRVSQSDKTLFLNNFFQLYEEEKAAHDKSKKELKKLKEDLTDSKQDVERLKGRGDSSRTHETSSERRV